MLLKKIKKSGVAAVLLCLGLVLGFYFFQDNQVKASSDIVEFVDDVILDLPGLSTTTYIASGSKCDNLVISGTDLTVNAVFAGPDYFRLKTSTHKVLEIIPSGGTADFVFSSDNVSSGGYLGQWREKSSISVEHKVGVPTANDDYVVKVDGIAIGTFNSGSGAEITFTRTGTGSWETYSIHFPSCQHHNVWGYAWSENIGWISFSCQNCDSDLDGNLDGDACGSGSSIDYGVDIDPNTGLFSGYAWSENIGWIQFDAGYPTGETPTYSACLDLPGTGQVCDGTGDYTVSGWARVLAPVGQPFSVSGGWDGWIKLSGSWADGVTLNSTPDPSEFEGWAWGSDVVGWVSFNRTNCDTDGDGKSNGGTGCPISGTTVANYKVMTSLNSLPYAESLFIKNEEYCANSPLGLVEFNWTYKDDDGDSQVQYHLQVATDSGFENKVVNNIADQGVVVGGVGTAVVNVKQNPTGPLDIAYDKTYWWRIKVKDTAENWSSDWIEGPTSFDTPAHPYPNPDFSWDPLDPSAGVEVTFEDKSSCYTGTGSDTCQNLASSYLWEFGDGETTSQPTDEPMGNTTHTYYVSGDYTVRLEVTDDVGMCPAVFPLTAALPLPIWQETSPF